MDSHLTSRRRASSKLGTNEDAETRDVGPSSTAATLEPTQLLRALRALKRGDFSVRLPDGIAGVDGAIAEAFNDVVELNDLLARELERISTVVGKEGKISQRGKLLGAAGSWEACIDSVNSLIGDVVQPTTEVARVIGAVAKGDLSQTILLEIGGRPLRGEFLRIGKVVNTMVHQLGSFAAEVTRVAREVGTEGKLGGQARVKGVAGTWKDLTDNVNLMAANLTSQVRNIADVTTAVARGDLSKKITVDVKGEILELKNTINTMVDQLNAFAGEVTRVAREVGTEGKLGGQAQVRGVAGTWKDLTDNVNLMAANLTGQVRNIAEVTTAVASGDLSKKITVDVKGEILELKNTINTMVDQLNSFASEVTRVAREVGTEGKLGGQAQVKGVAGTWKDLTDNVNLMAANLTSQVRGIADVVTAVATGNLKRKLAVDASGEIAALADTINGMIETLATFADQVTNVAREVGIEGKLGGQARVPGAAGLWRDLTDNVNQLAANLTTQVRAIAEVATAVTKGDLTRSITVEALGEVAALKDNINEMIRNLADTTRKNNDQDWLKTNLAKFSRMLQGQRDLVTVTNLILSEMAPLVNASHGVFYLSKADDEEEFLELVASYAYTERKHLAKRFRMREGLIGQCAFEKRRILLVDVPGSYVQISSGLGEAAPLNIVVLPVLFEGDVKGVLELASFSEFSETHQTFLDQLMESIGIVLNTIAANMRTEGLLAQSQLLTSELQSQQAELKKTNDRLEQQAAFLQKSEELLKNQQEELRQTNEELEDKAQLLSSQKKQVELKNQEIERAKAALEEKAEQLALTSKYKSEFLANMSHELRTPLNSLLVLSKLLSENVDKNLSEKQVQFSETIHTAGTELLALINDILDLSKIESGTVTLDIGEVNLADLRSYVSRSFDQIAQDKSLDFTVDVDDALPKTVHTDVKRLQQVLKNLLSNAFKFTAKGGVKLTMSHATHGWNLRNSILNAASTVVAFSVRDTGIGIPADKQRIIFEAFQQADGTTSRKYGGTGLGLSISREIARLLGGEIAVASAPDQGSTFTLYLPVTYDVAAAASRPTLSTEVLAPAVERPKPMPKIDIADDREGLEAGGRLVLIVEDDPRFAAIVLDAVRERGFKGIVTSQAGDALTFARRYKPDAITVDLRLPDMDGWRLIDMLKRNPETRHIPVSIVSADDGAARDLSAGAFSVLTKPVSREALGAALERTEEFLLRKVKQLLVVEDDDVQRSHIVRLIGNGDVEATCVSTGQAALVAIRERHFDCVILDLVLPDMEGLSVLERIRADTDRALPVIVHTAKELSAAEQSRLRRLAGTVIAKEKPGAPERLFDESSLFLHRAVSRMPEEKRDLLATLRQREPALAGRKVLIVDDDVRNIFSLASALEQHQIEVLHAENGRDGMALLDLTPEIDMVFMDIMMPEMDGYETTRSIRSRSRFKDLPIIALTAKAMKGDREKCLEAGASDYLAKPVDIEQVLSAVRVWSRKQEQERQ
jgi:CheY-like chemotaxis protein/HAMP domain-containing protein